MSVETAQYAAAVGAALSDLPERVRNELLEDLPAHLAEVAAEIEAEGNPKVTLVDRLGTPTAYAAELRTTLDGNASRSGRVALLSQAMATLLSRWGRFDRRLGPVIGYEKISDFAVLLRPAWWVLRGYLAALLFADLFADNRTLGLLPRAGGSGLMGVLLLLGFVIGSIWLGRRAGRAKLPARLGLGVATVVIVLYGLGAWITADARLADSGGDTNQASYYQPYDPYQGVLDVYALDEQGRVLGNVRLVDQNGNPLLIGSCAQWQDRSNGGEWRVTYPVPGCQAEPPNLPWVLTTPKPLPWRAVPAEPTPSPTVPPAPTRAPAATPAPVVTPAPATTPAPGTPPVPSATGAP